jgi:hypothetical protein
MANVLYDVGRNYFLNGSINWLNDPIRVALVSISNQPTAYVFNASLDTVYASVPTGARVGFSIASVGSKTATSGIADGADTVFSAVSGPTIGALIVLRSSATANASDWPMIAYIDTATGMPVGPNGGDITVQWDNGTNKIFKL